MATAAEISPLDVAALVERGRVQGSVYTDPRIFALEIERIFARTWNYVGHESQVPAPGDYFATSVAQRPVLMIRGQDAKIRVLRNRCAHRGAKLISERCGNARLLRCPYHGWSYHGDGRLAAVPRRDGYAGISGLEKEGEGGEGGYRLTPLRTASYRGFVFASLASEVPELEDFLGSARGALDNMVDRSPDGELEIAGGCFRALQRNNWKVYLENLHDGIHPPSVHASSIAASRAQIAQCEQSGTPVPFPVEVVAANGVGHGQMGEIEVACYPYGHSDMRGFRQPVDESELFESYRALLAERHGPERAMEILSTNIHNLSIYPNASAHPGFMQMRVLLPLTVDTTAVEMWTLRLKGAPEVLHQRNISFANTVHSPSSIVKVDDLEVYRRVQQGLAAGDEGWVSQHRDCPRGSALGEHYIRNQFRAWSGYMTEKP